MDKPVSAEAQTNLYGFDEVGWGLVEARERKRRGK